MSYRDSEGWQTDTTSVFSNGPDQLPTQAPQHPIPTMQGAFEESMMETLKEADDNPNDPSKLDAIARRRLLLEGPTYERTVAGRWKQKSGENFHPLWKLVAQISFGMHLLHQGLAKSDEEVIKILQTHVDEVDGFLERTTEDLDLAQKDIEERIRYLKLPLEHGDVFDNMLGDRKFRNAILEGNEKIEHIVDRTGVSLRDTLKDVKKGYDGTRELSRYFRKLDSTWENQTEEHMGVYAAMMGNTEGWTGAYLELQKKGDALHASLVELSGIIAEIQRRVGIASRKNLPSAPSSRTTTQPSSRATSIYNTQSTPQSPTKPHITSAIGTGMRNRHPSQRTPNERWADSYAGDRYRRPSTGGTGAEAASNGHQRRGSDDSTNKRVSFSERSAKRLSGDSWRDSNSQNKRHSKEKFGDAIKTSWFRKSSAESSTSSLKDKRKSQSNPTLVSQPMQTPYDPETGVRTTRSTVSKPSSRENAYASPPGTMSPMRMSESVGVQPSSSISRRPPRDSIPNDAIEEVTEDEAESEEEPEAEIVEASKIEQKPADVATTAKEINIPTPAGNFPQRPMLRDLPLRNYKSTDSLPEGREAEQKALKYPAPNLQNTVNSLRRSASLNAAAYSLNEARRGSEPIPEQLRLSAMSSFSPFGNAQSSGQSSSESTGVKTDAIKVSKRPANLKLFPTIPAGRTMSPGPKTAPLDKTKSFFPSSPMTESMDRTEKLPKMPQTPAERGRSPPPPERVPTPLQDKQSVSPSLKALTSATVNGPEPDFPYGFGEEDEDGERQEPFIAELSARPATADGDRDSLEETAELGTESPAMRHPKSSPFIDPEERREEIASKQRDREARLTAEKRRVQEQIMSKVMEQSVGVDVSKPRRDDQYPTGDTKQLHAPPIISPPAGQSPYPKHSPLTVAASTTSLASGPNYNLPYSKHNPIPLKERKFPWRRLFRFGRSAGVRNNSVETSETSVDGETASLGNNEQGGVRKGARKLFGNISLSISRLTHRRNQSKDNGINSKGGLQPFGFWKPDNQGMSWGDTRRGSGSASRAALNSEPAEPTERQPTVTPRPEQGTMSIPGVGTIDFSRASTYVKLEKEKQAYLQSLLQQEHEREEAERQKKEEENELARLVAERKEALALAEKGKEEARIAKEEDAKAKADAQESDDKSEETDESEDAAVAHDTENQNEEAGEQEEHENHRALSTKSSFELNLPTAKTPEAPMPKMNFPKIDYPKVEIPEVTEPVRHPLTDDSMISPTTVPMATKFNRISTSDPAQADPTVTANPKAEEPISATSAEYATHHSSRQTSTKASSEASASSESRSNRESSQLRKSDATPNTGLSLLLSPSLTSEIFAHGTHSSADNKNTADSESAEAETQEQQHDDDESEDNENGDEENQSQASRQASKSPEIQHTARTSSNVESPVVPPTSAHQSPTLGSQPWHPKRTSSLTSSAATSPVDRSMSIEGKAAQVLGIATGARGMGIGARSPALGADINPIDSKMGAQQQLQLSERDAVAEQDEEDEESETSATEKHDQGDRRSVDEDSQDDVDDENESDSAPDALGIQKREGLSNAERPLSEGSEAPMSPSFLDGVPNTSSFLDREYTSMDEYVRDPIKERHGTPF